MEFLRYILAFFICCTCVFSTIFCVVYFANEYFDFKIMKSNDCQIEVIRIYDDEEIKGFYDGPLMTAEEIKSISI